jgi:hypothetical protein
LLHRGIIAPTLDGRSLGCVPGYQLRLCWVTSNPVPLYDLAEPVEISLVPDLLGLYLEDVLACIDDSTRATGRFDRSAPCRGYDLSILVIHNLYTHRMLSLRR